MRFVPGIEVITHLLLYNFSCILITGNSMVSRVIWKNIHSRVFQRLQITLVLLDFMQCRSSFNNSLVHIFFQIALETVQMPIPTTIIPKRLFRYLSIMHYHYFALFQQAGILSALVNNFRRIQKITLKVFRYFSGRFW